MNRETMNSDKGITSFIFMGDPQCSRLRGKPKDYSRWGELLKRALFANGGGSAAENNQLLILGGDIVNRGDRLEEWEAFFEKEYTAVKAAGMEISDLKMATVPTGSAESIGLFAGRFLNPGNGPEGHEKEFFSFDYGCCHFLFLSSEYMGSCDPASVEYISDWIRSDLSTNRKPVCFAVMHHPLVTVGAAFDDYVRAAAMTENYLSLLWEGGVDFILCGHQHVYCRTKEPADSAKTLYITQLMGVSGTKYFDAECKSNMAAVREYVSVATLFETDGETIRLKTIDADGNVLDEHEQQARKPGIMDPIWISPAHAEGDPLRPANREGITVTIFGTETERSARCTDRSVHFTDAELDRIATLEVRYSVMRRSRLHHETYCGFRLSELLERARERTLAKQPDPSETVIVLTDSKGRQKCLLLDRIMTAWSYPASAGEERCSVPALMITEDDGYRLIVGQQIPEEYNGSSWMRDIRRIEMLSYKHFLLYNCATI